MNADCIAAGRRLGQAWAGHQSRNGMAVARASAGWAWLAAAVNRGAADSDLRADCGQRRVSAPDQCPASCKPMCQPPPPPVQALARGDTFSAVPRARRSVLAGQGRSIVQGQLDRVGLIARRSEVWRARFVNRHNEGLCRPAPHARRLARATNKWQVREAACWPGACCIRSRACSSMQGRAGTAATQGGGQRVRPVHRPHTRQARGRLPGPAAGQATPAVEPAVGLDVSHRPPRCSPGAQVASSPGALLAAASSTQRGGGMIASCPPLPPPTTTPASS